LNISRERVPQLEAQAMRKLRAPACPLACRADAAQRPGRRRGERARFGDPAGIALIEQSAAVAGSLKTQDHALVTALRCFKVTVG